MFLARHDRAAVDDRTVAEQRTRVTPPSVTSWAVLRVRMDLLQHTGGTCDARATAGRGTVAQAAEIARAITAGELLANARMGKVIRALAVVIAFAACAYKPGSFESWQAPGYPSKAFAGQRVTVGCLDLAVDRRDDMDASAVLGFAFGNRCDHATVVDLASATVVGRTVDGKELTLAPYDPKHELRALRIDGRRAGREALAYPAEVALAQVCVDVASLAHTAPAQWLCFGSDGATIAAVTP